MTHLVQLIPIGKDDSIVSNIGEHLFPHFPTLVLFESPKRFSFSLILGDHSRFIRFSPSLLVIRDEVRVREVDD